VTENFSETAGCKGGDKEKGDATLRIVIKREHQMSKEIFVWKIGLIQSAMGEKACKTLLKGNRCQVSYSSNLMRVGKEKP